MADESFSEFLIRIGVDKASWDKLVKRFTTLERTEKQLKKDFMDFGKIQKKVFSDGAQYVKAFNAQLTKTLAIYRQLNRIAGIGPQTTKRIAQFQQGKALTLQNIGGIHQIAGVGPAKIQKIKQELVKDFYAAVEKDLNRAKTNLTKVYKNHPLHLEDEIYKQKKLKGYVSSATPKSVAQKQRDAEDRMFEQIQREQIRKSKIASMPRGTGKTVEQLRTQRKRDILAAFAQADTERILDYDAAYKQATKLKANQYKRSPWGGRFPQGYSPPQLAAESSLPKGYDPYQGYIAKFSHPLSKPSGNEAAAIEQATKNMLGLNKAKSTGVGLSKEQLSAEKQIAETGDKVSLLNDKIAQQERFRALYAKKAAQTKKSDLYEHDRANRMEMEAFNKLNSLTAQRNNMLIKQQQLAKKVAREFGDNELNATIDKIGKLRNQLNKLDTSKSDILKKRVGALRSDLDQFETGAIGSKTRKEFDELNRTIGKTGAEIKNLEANHKKAAGEMGKRQSLINTRFGSFSIIMSGIAASMFVFQELLQFVRFLSAPTLEAERAWKDLALTFAGTRQEMEMFFEKGKEINLTGYMKIGEVTKELSALRSSGFDAKEALVLLDIQMQLAIKNEGPLDKFIRKMTAFWRSLMTPENFKPFSAELLEQEEKVAKQNVKNPNRRRATSMSALSPFRREDIIAAQKGKTNPALTIEKPSQLQGAPIYTGSQQKFGPVDGIWFDSLEEANTYRLNREAGKTALSKYASLTGRQSPLAKKFYQDRRQMQLEAMKNIRGENILDEFGQFLDDEEFKKNVEQRLQAEDILYNKIGRRTEQYYVDQAELIKNQERKNAGLIGKENAAKLADNARFNLKLEEQKNEFLKMSPGVQRKQEKMRTEFDIVTPGMQRIWEWERKERTKRAERTGDRDPQTQAIIDQADLIKRHGQTMESVIKIEERYYKDTKHMSADLFKDRKWYIIEESNLLMKQGLDRERAVETARIRYRELTREYAAGQAVWYGLGKTSTEGLKAHIKNLEATSQTVAQQWQQRWATMIDGTEQSVHGFFYTFFQSENKSLSESFKSLGNTFKQMVDKMASDLIASGLMRGLFGKLYDGNMSGFGIFDFFNSTPTGFGGSGHVAPNGAWVGAGGTTAYGFDSGGHIGETVRGVGLQSGKSYEFHENESVIPDRKLKKVGSSNVQIVVNNNSGQKAEVSETKGPGNMRKILVTIGASDIANGGPMSRAIEQTYGLRRAGRNV